MADRAQTVPSPTGSGKRDSLSALRTAGASARSKRVAAVAIATGLAAAGTVAGGCNNDAGDTFAEYEGTWRISGDPALTNRFPLDCPDPDDPYQGPYPLFTTVMLKLGTVTDLFDVSGSGSCQFGYDHVSGMKSLSVVNPDPFTGGPVKCSVNMTNTTDFFSNDPVTRDLFITPTDWVFNLLPTPKGKPPLAQLVAHAVVDRVDTARDTDGVPRILASSPCTYAIAEYLEKAAKP